MSLHNKVKMNSDLSKNAGGGDQVMRICVTIAEAFEEWACKHIDFDRTYLVWPYQLEGEFGNALISALGEGWCAIMSDATKETLGLITPRFWTACQYLPDAPLLAAKFRFKPSYYDDPIPKKFVEYEVCAQRIGDNSGEYEPCSIPAAEEVNLYGVEPDGTVALIFSGSPAMVGVGQVKYITSKLGIVREKEINTHFAQYE